MPRFIKGIELSEIFYREAVKPIMESKFPNIKYATALIGFGSETLGYDTPMSMDHHWGPRLNIFISERNYKLHKDNVWNTIAENLPYEIKGIPTNFGKPNPKDGNGVQQLKQITSGKVNHHVYIENVRDFFKKQILIDPYKNPTFKDWLAMPQQKLLEVTEGKVFYDGIGDLTRIRTKFKYYPKDVWLYMLACQWVKIAQEDAFVGRCHTVGDELGSKIVASKMVKYLMELSFLLEKKYVPYSKWLGTGFNKLRISKRLSPTLTNVLLSKTFKEREKWLSKSYTIAGETYNSLKITKPLPTNVVTYFSRPFLILKADVYAEETFKLIKDPKIRKLPRIGSINQFTDSTDFLENNEVLNKSKELYT